MQLFGIESTLGASSTSQVTIFEANDNPLSMITVAPGLKASVVSAAVNLGYAPDMMVLYPNDTKPTHIIACNEVAGPNSPVPSAGGVQRIRLSDGFVENIISSPLVSCDPVEITPWGTVIAGEENGSNGRMFEILDPLNTTDVIVTGTGVATTTDSVNVRYIAPLGQLSFEGISVLPNGVTYYQDENRPGKGLGGGGYFKFIPNNLWAGGAPITDLNNSPLIAGGRVFALRLGRNSNNTDFGPGNNEGRGVWVEVTDGKFGASSTTAGVDRLNLRAAALTLKATTGYRPEDQDIDKKAASLGNVRICGTNTGQDTSATLSNGDNNFGTTFCMTDGSIAESAVIATATQTVSGVDYVINTGAGTSIPEYQTLIEHFLDFGMPDNVAYQPGLGNWVINEDGDGYSYPTPRNNDIWSCLDDGADQDHLSDACVKVATLNDLNAETTGGVFNATGKDYYVSIQHNVTGHGAIVKISGWKTKSEHKEGDNKSEHKHH